MLATFNRVRVLLVDSDVDTQRFIQERLDPERYHLQIVKGWGFQIIDEAFERAQAFRPHIVITEQNLRQPANPRDESGMELILRIHEWSDSTKCILYTFNNNSQVAARAMKDFGAFYSDSKRNDPEEFLKNIESAAMSLGAFLPGTTIHRPAHLQSLDVVATLFGHDLNAPPVYLIDDVLHQFIDIRKVVSLHDDGFVIVGSGSTPRSNSVVMKAFRDNYQPTIVKIARNHQIKRETENYNRHIKMKMGGLFQTSMIASTRFWDVGALEYVFIGSEEQVLPSFGSYYLRPLDAEVIMQPLHHFFKVAWNLHYDNAVPTQRSLFDIYNGSLRISERLQKLHDEGQQLEIPELSLPLCDPIAWITEFATRSLLPNVRTAVTHGDLHADNLLVGTNTTWPIDFERTGEGHILRDFVELEVDLLTRLLRVDTLESFYKVVALILDDANQQTTDFLYYDKAISDNAELHKLVKVIEGLRNLSHEVTQVADLREYLWGMLFDSLFLVLTLQPDSERYRRAYILSSLLCERLSRVTP